ncbi:MAG: 4Fe-4S binding protein [Bacteroidetes bacterium]|nr:4Fe-4S binding protein [Bacteroidota bacterium]
MGYGIVSTIGQKCKRCYSCVRECPAKAIRVENGQAVVITERCISCGHCVKVCSQNAKKVDSDVDRIVNELMPYNDVIAIIAPAFAASFPDNYMKLPTALREMGFKMVIETAFGADLVSQLYLDSFENGKNKTLIASPCPAIYNYLEKFFTNLVPNLAQIVSPMIAVGKYIKKNHEADTKVVFIGPCIAKKSEYQDEEVAGVIDAVMTFTELKEFFGANNISLDGFVESNFDPPYSYFGKSFPLTGGLIKTAGMSNDILAKDVIVVDGKEKVEEIIADLAANKINSKFIDILFCEGCINGPGIESDLNYYSKREKVIEYIDKNIHCVDKNVWKSELYNSRDLDLTRTFKPKSQRKTEPTEEVIKDILAKTNKFNKKDELNCGACGYHTCREYAIAISKDLAEEDMCLPHVIEKLEKAYEDLKSTQDQLHNAEKLASIGQLAAGVAHEMNNPLGTILLYSSMLKKEIVKASSVSQNVEDLSMIIDEAKRCKGIVSNLLDFARQGKLKISRVDIAEMLDEVTRNMQMRSDFEDVKIIKMIKELESHCVDGDGDQIRQILINLISNACEAMEEREHKLLQIDLNSTNDFVEIKIKDNGCGIPEANIKQLFTPFFTTKKMGKGTGLGLAIVYGIIKMHRGEINITSKLGEGSEIIVKLPKIITKQNGQFGIKENSNASA